MRLIFDYDVLVKNLADIAEVVEDTALSEDMKNVVIAVKNNKVEMIGENPLITFIRKVDDDKVVVEGGEESNVEPIYIQIRSKELVGFLNSYKGLRYTEIEELSFDVKDNGTVLCKVLEQYKDKEQGSDHYISSWSFVNIPLNANRKQSISRVTPTVELTEIATKELTFYTKNLFPMLQAGATLYSRMTFGSDYALVTGPAHMTFMENKLGETFKGVQFMHRAVAFMDKVLCTEDTIKVAKTPTDIYVETTNSYAYIRYDDKLPNYSNYLNMFQRNAYVTVNRIYLKDILKRLSLIPTAVEVTVDTTTNKIRFKNEKFNQELPILDSEHTDVIDRNKFKIMPEVLAKAILGSDSEFSGDLSLYYIPQKNDTAIYLFEDDTKTWFSSVSVRAYN